MVYTTATWSSQIQK